MGLNEPSPFGSSITETNATVRGQRPVASARIITSMISSRRVSDKRSHALGCMASHASPVPHGNVLRAARS